MSEMVENESVAEPIKQTKPVESEEKAKVQAEEFPLPDWVAAWARDAPKISIRAPGPKSKEIIKIDRDYVSYAYDRCFTFTIDRASGAAVMDADGNVLLDFSSGIAVQNAGWTHYKVTKAIQDQAAKLIHSMANDAYFDKEAHFAKLLHEISPNKALKGTFFGNSGAEAVEAAFKLSRYHTKRNEHVAFFGSYHGRVGAGLALTSKLKLRYSYGPMSPGIVFTPYAYCYRCSFKQTYPECGMWCIDYLENQVLQLGGTTNQIASIFVEPIQGEGGYVVPPKEFLPQLKKICESQNALLVMDEVQTGFARTGKMFACEHFNTVPDILVMGKALGGGVPLGAIIAKHDIMRKWRPGSHSSTFGGNAITMAAGLAHVQAIIEENLVDRAAKLGEYATKLLKEMSLRREIIGDVRGRGLMIGVELVKNQYTKEPHEATNIQGKCWRSGLMTITSGFYGNVFRIAPPLCISKAQLEIGFEIFEQALKEEEEFLKIGTSSPGG
ncbi:MAG: aspartate aminotransferase family protein [Thermoplasmata archaeon]|nr:aspartate aminotransferase family protein [Thermoplasmata archaeon]TFG70145.1 MAG: aspartate aminotransferase family protein [Methanomassiliicoccus sp.]